MATGDWYYQVWEHYGLRNRVKSVAIFKFESQAQEAAQKLNEEAMSKGNNDVTPPSFFFVQPVLEEHLHGD